MKKHIPLFTTMLIVYSLSVCGQSIQFQPKMPFDSLLAASKSSGKLIFIDVYTDWCGPCKAMEQEVFPIKNVADKLNAGFINYKLDAEKFDGPQLAKRYRVNSYPTYLFVNEKGTLVYRANGSMPVADFLKELANALKEKNEKVTLVEMDSMYAAKKKDTAFMYTYLQRRTRLKQENADLLDEYCMLIDPSQQSSIKTLQLIADNGGFLVKNLQVGPALTVLLNNRQKFGQLKTMQGLDGYISVAQQRTLKKAIDIKSEKLLGDVLALNRDQNHDVYDDRNDDMLKIKYYYGTKQYKTYMTLTGNFMDKKIMIIPIDTLMHKDAEVLADENKYFNEHYADKPVKERQEMAASYAHTQTIDVVRLINNNCTDLLTVPGNQLMISKGKRWMKHSVALAETDTTYFKNIYPECLHLYATYLYKAGEKQAAISSEEKAIRQLLAMGVKSTNTILAGYQLALVKMKKASLANPNKYSEHKSPMLSTQPKPL